jgi:hypothetical protein
MNHQLFWTVVLFVVSALISIFSQEIRVALKKGNISITRIYLTVTEGRLNILNGTHGNAYGLIFWLSQVFCQLLLETIIVLSVMFIAVEQRWLAIHSWPLPLGFIAGSWFAVTLDVWRMLSYLFNYERSKTKLEQRIARLQSKLQHKTASQV